MVDAGDAKVGFSLVQHHLLAELHAIDRRATAFVGFDALKWVDFFQTEWVFQGNGVPLP